MRKQFFQVDFYFSTVFPPQTLVILPAITLITEIGDRLLYLPASRASFVSFVSGQETTKHVYHKKRLCLQGAPLLTMVIHFRTSLNNNWGIQKREISSKLRLLAGTRTLVIASCVREEHAHRKKTRKVQKQITGLVTDYSQRQRNSGTRTYRSFSLSRNKKINRKPFSG